MYYYRVFYQYGNRRKKLDGKGIVGLESPITSSDDIDEVKGIICFEKHIKDCVIQRYILLENYKEE